MKTLQITPELLVEDMSKTVHFYENILGFQPQIIFPETNPVFVTVGREDVSIMRRMAWVFSLLICAALEWMWIS